jgi:hypothetical protein
MIRAARDLCFVGIAVAWSGVIVGGNWMRAATGIAGATLLPLVLLAATNYGDRFERALRGSGTPPRRWFRYAFAGFAGAVAALFIGAAALGGASVTKPGLLLP